MQMRLRPAARTGAALLLLALTMAGCARPTGDFGRAAPSVLHDRVMPAVGAHLAGQAGEPVSGFVLTDEEREMHDRVWRFLVAPHSHDWFQDIAVEWQRTRLTGVTDMDFATDRYYEHLRATPYTSSTVRYATLAHAIDMDIATLPSTFLAICAVIETDRRRAVAVAQVDHPGSAGEANVSARRAENAARIAWFTRALRYRHASYAVALDRLLVETPHEEARALPARLQALDIFARRAEAGVFCPGASGAVQITATQPLPSRVERGPELDPK